jgi:DNA-binding XRE family transcriptional regulator
MNDLQSYLDQALKQVKITGSEDVHDFEDYDIEGEVSGLVTSTRNALGMTQRQLAEKSGVSQANISRIENGNYRPSIAILKRLADGLGKRLVIEFAAMEDGE